MRWAQAADYQQLGDVMFDAVRRGDSLYSEGHRQAWVPAPRHGEVWDKRLAEQRVALFENAGRIHGFMSLDSNGHIDLAFVRPDAQRAGVFRKLYLRIEKDAVSHGLRQLTTHASLMAQPAFTAVGFDIVKHEVVQIGAYDFKRAEMQKQLHI